jgi:hypothetical protein
MIKKLLLAALLLLLFFGYVFYNYPDFMDKSGNSITMILPDVEKGASPYFIARYSNKGNSVFLQRFILNYGFINFFYKKHIASKDYIVSYNKAVAKYESPIVIAYKAGKCDSVNSPGEWEEINYVPDSFILYANKGIMTLKMDSFSSWNLKNAYHIPFYKNLSWGPAFED